MHSSSSVLSATNLVLAHARHLHRAVRSQALSSSLPVLRRLQRAGVNPELSLPAFWAARGMLQRKHILRMLAREMGFTDWEACRPHVDRCAPDAVDHLKLGHEWTGRFSHWYANEAQARAHQREHGGRLLRWGDHTVVALTEESSHDA